MNCKKNYENKFCIDQVVSFIYLLIIGLLYSFATHLVNVLSKDWSLKQAHFFRLFDY